jgi:hypothetical protein
VAVLFDSLNMIGPRKLIRLWICRLEAYFLDVIMGKRHGPAARAARGALWGFSKVYNVAAKIRR